MASRRPTTSTAYGLPDYLHPQTDLAGRVAGVGGNMPAAMGNYHPAGTPDTLMVMPMVAVRVGADRVQVEHLQPLWVGPAAAPVPASSPGRWAQLYAAGQP